MTEHEIHRLLRECGFRDMLAFGPSWAVAGELDGGFPITVSCHPRPNGGFHLDVPSASARDWLREMLQQNGATSVELRLARETPPWIPVAIGAGAVALFGWIVSSIAR